MINMENRNSRFRRGLLTILTALMLAASAGVVMADGSDPLDPSDGGADWDGDGLTNAEEQANTQRANTQQQYKTRRRCKKNNNKRPNTAETLPTKERRKAADNIKKEEEDTAGID